MHDGRDARGWLVTPAVLILGLLFAYPVAALLLMSVTSPQPDPDDDQPKLGYFEKDRKRRSGAYQSSECDLGGPTGFCPLA